MSTDVECRHPLPAFGPRGNVSACGRCERIGAVGVALPARYVYSASIGRIGAAFDRELTRIERKIGNSRTEDTEITEVYCHC